jgi:chemotaxis protein CheD
MSALPIQLGCDEAKRVYLPPGQILVSTEPLQVTTILGSCVAVCLWDPELRLGGINHFLLPQTQGEPSPRFGETSTRVLVERVLAFGARPERLVAKVFGGASVLAGFRDGAGSLGERNAEAACAILAGCGVPVVGGDVGGRQGRKLVFDLRTGNVWVKPIAGSR